MHSFFLFCHSIHSVFSNCPVFFLSFFFTLLIFQGKLNLRIPEIIVTIAKYLGDYFPEVRDASASTLVDLGNECLFFSLLFFIF